MGLFRPTQFLLTLEIGGVEIYEDESLKPTERWVARYKGVTTNAPNPTSAKCQLVEKLRAVADSIERAMLPL